MPVPRIVRGQQVEEAKVLRAKELRRESTPAEQLLWSRLRGSQLSGFHFRRQQIVRGFIADFYCHKAALIIELDGDAHKGQEDYDADRDRILNANGFLTIRFENRQVAEGIDSVLTRIASLCVERTSKVGN